MRALRASLVALCACACAGIDPLPEPGQPALLVIDCQPPDAWILIDDQPMGLLPQWRDNTIPLRPGARRVEIGREGYYPWLMDLEAAPGRLYRLQLDLVPALESLEDDGATQPDADLEGGLRRDRHEPIP
jgi:hypothetical protein